VRIQLLILIFCFSFLVAHSQEGDYASLFNPADSAHFHRRTTTLAIVGGTAYAASMFGLYQLWYKDYPQSDFHFFNDNREWMRSDKLGHITTSYYLGSLGYDAWRWAGMGEKKATWIGGLTGFFHLLTVETFDGFSSGWGASSGDLTANTIGSALFISQQLIWQEQKVVLKWSYHSTSFPDYRPDLLGSNFFQQSIKDYNGQTFWLSANLRSFSAKHARLPHWLNIAAGYRATGMTGAETNSTVHEGKTIPYFERQQLVYIAPDIDLTRIRTRSVALKWVFEAIGFLKFPLPALQFGGQGVKLKPFYF
jgi:hypothetical protein